MGYAPADAAKRPDRTVATAVSVLALFAAGAALVFGEELGHLVRRALLLVVAIAFSCSATLLDGAGPHGSGDMSDRPRTIPIHLSLIRPILLMGAERELAISGILAAVLVMSLARLLFTLSASSFGALSLAALQTRCESDPQFTRVYLRHTRYRGYYSAPIARDIAPFNRAGGDAVLNLREFRSTAKGLPDLLNYAAVVDDGVVPQGRQSHSSMDVSRRRLLDSASVPELSSLSARVNRGVRAPRQWAGWSTSTRCVPKPRISGDRGLSRSYDLTHRRGAGERPTRPKARTMRAATSSP